MKHRKMYMCDPEKNKECRKDYCIHKDGKYRVCCQTEKLECALKNKRGKPIEARWFRVTRAIDKANPIDWKETWVCALVSAITSVLLTLLIGLLKS